MLNYHACSRIQGDKDRQHHLVSTDVTDISLWVPSPPEEYFLRIGVFNSISTRGSQNKIRLQMADNNFLFSLLNSFEI